MSTIEMTDMEDDTITVYARHYLWQQYAGPYTLRKCLYPWCNRMMNQETFCVIYYDNTDARDITSIHNMRPVCDVCYASMRLPTMREWVDHMDHTYSKGTYHSSNEDRSPSPVSSDPPQDNHMES